MSGKSVKYKGRSQFFLDLSLHFVSQLLHYLDELKGQLVNM